jgi:hypothetical protein
MEASTFWNPQGLSRPVMGLLYLYLFIKYGIFFVVTLPTVERCSLYKTKLSKLQLVHNQQPGVVVHFNN